MTRGAPLRLLLVLFPCWWSVPASAGEQPFDGGFVVETHDGGFAVYAADFEGDGDTDLLSCVSSPWEILRGARNFNGLGTNWSTFPIVGTDVKSVVTGDFDRDGDPDLGVAGANDVLVMSNDGGNYPAVTAQVDSSFAGAHGLTAGDVDGDGDIDLVGAANGTSIEDVSWFENTAGDGSAWTTRLIDPTFDGARAVVTADFDGDGDLDVAAAAEFDDAVAFYRNGGGGASWTGITVNTTPIDQPVTLIAADLDHDGKIDLAGAALAGADLRWWRNAAGTGSSWTENVIDGAYDGAFGLTAADLDADGDLDLIASAEAGGARLDVFDNVAGDGSVFVPYTVESGDPLRGVTVADLDRDGKNDLVATGPARLEWWKNLAIDQSVSFLRRTPVDGTVQVNALAAGDLDRDGDLDLASTASSGRVAFHRNDGGSFALLPVPIHYAGANSVAIADVDGDGKNDLIATTADAGFPQVVWFENSAGNGTSWKPFTVDGILAGATSPAAGDLDADGDLDLLAAGGSQVVWYENVPGDGTVFTEAVVATDLSGAIDVNLGDVDRDGDLDVVFAATGEEGVFLSKNTAGDGSAWSLGAVVNNFFGARAVRVADLDRDGDLDVLAGAETAGEVAWYENDGTGGGWTAHPMDDDLPGVKSLEVADLDLDGDLDVLVAPGATGGTVWLENLTGDGTSWGTHPLDTDFAGAYAVVSADFDHDGRPDQASAASSELAIRINYNGGGQYGLAAAGTSPFGIGNAAEEDLLRLDFVHHGRPGAPSIELAQLELLLEETAGDPLTSAEANAIFEEVRLHRDDGGAEPGVWDASDPQVASVETLSLTGGLQLIPILDGDPDLMVAQGSSRTYFVVVRTTADYDEQALASFRMSFRGSPAGTTLVEDAAHDTPLRAADADPMSSPTLAVFQDPLFRDGFEAGDTSAWTSHFPP